MDTSLIPQPLKDLGKSTLSGAANKFVDFIITKYTGSSLKVIEAKGEVEADKVKSTWEQIEKPLWLQAESIKINRQYNNLGKVLQKASINITSEENKISDDNDFFWGITEHAKEISNDQMQELISKIIAGEYNIPGTYSMSTLQVVKMLGKKELELFEQVCGLLVNGQDIPENIFSLPTDAKKLMKELNIDYASLQTLQSLGLFLPNEMMRSFSNPKKLNITINYFSKEIKYTAPDKDYEEIELPSFYALTTVGKQLLKHLNPTYNEDYFRWLKNNYKIARYTRIDTD